MCTFSGGRLLAISKWLYFAFLDMFMTFWRHIYFPFLFYIYWRLIWYSTFIQKQIFTYRSGDHTDTIMTYFFQIFVILFWKSPQSYNNVLSVAIGLIILWSVYNHINLYLLVHVINMSIMTCIYDSITTISIIHAFVLDFLKFRSKLRLQNFISNNVLHAQWCRIIYN